MKAMKRFFVTIYLYIIGLFVKKKAASRLPKVKREATLGHYATLTNLLNDLDETFKSISKLEPSKSHVQRALVRYGCYILDASTFGDDEGNVRYFLRPQTNQIDQHRLEGVDAYGLPAYLFCFINSKPFDDCHALYYATKCTKLPHIGCRKDRVYYEFGVVLSHTKRHYKPLEATWYVEIAPDHTIKAMPVLSTWRQTITYRKERQMCQKTINRTGWVLVSPDASYNGKDNTEKKMRMIEQLFRFCYNATMLREYGINIIVKKDGRRATFVVEQDRWKYFFKDRIKITNEKGNTRRIFHAVMAHYRNTKNGQSTVKTHYRGLRHFAWNGYDINIVIPGRHGMSQAAFNISDAGNDPAARNLISDDHVYGGINSLIENNDGRQLKTAIEKAKRHQPEKAA